MASNIQPKNTLTSELALLSNYDSKDESHRLRNYISWMDQSAVNWFSPDLTTYREYLLNHYLGRNGKPLSPNSVKAHLSTIRSRYKSILRSNKIRDYFFNNTPNELSPSDRKALVDEILERIRNAIDPDNSPVKTVARQDIYDDAHIRLTKQQVSELISQPNTGTLIGKRDLAILALLLCTGIREAELCALDIKDLTKTFGGELSLHVRHGKGSKERLIPYGHLIWGLNLTQQWINSANITSDSVFRGFYRGGKRLRPTRLTVRAINQILDKYPVNVNDSLCKIAPHDIRRTYARQLYESNMDILAIRDNLGHVDSRTTLKYIGTMNVNQRKPKDIYSLSDIDLDQ
jgi:site-specific recombinase XerD